LIGDGNADPRELPADQSCICIERG
jgi:hypothetical protein